MTTEWQVFWAGVGVVVVGGIGLLLGFIFIMQADDDAAAEEARRERARRMASTRSSRRRMISAIAVAVLLASVAIYADDPNGACTEATLRVICGDYWYICYYTLGCQFLPG